MDFCKGGIAYSPLHIATYEQPALPCPLAPHSNVEDSVSYTTFNKYPPKLASPITTTRCTDQDGDLYICVKTTMELTAEELRLAPEGTMEESIVDVK